MIIIFVISFGAAVAMLIAGFLGSASVHSGVLNYFDNSREAHYIRRIRLRRHWIKTLILFAIAIWAGLNLY